MKSLISLELQKQRKTFFGILFIIAMSLTVVTASISLFADVTGGQAFLLVAAVLQGFGIPFFALLLGSTAGAALKNSERKAEEDLPIRPGKRIFAAYLSSLIYLLMLIAILFIVTAPVKNSDLQQDFFVPLVTVLLLPLHCSAFVFSYWLSQALLGGVVATIMTIPAYLFFPFWLSEVFNPSFRDVTAGPGLIATGLQLLGMFWLANRIEREKPIQLLAKIIIGALLVSSVLFSVGGTSLVSILNDQFFEPHCGCY